MDLTSFTNTGSFRISPFDLKLNAPFELFKRVLSVPGLWSAEVPDAILSVNAELTRCFFTVF